MQTSDNFSVEQYEITIFNYSLKRKGNKYTRNVIACSQDI